MIYYHCPDLRLKSAGIRILYRHIEILQRHGFSAAILHANVDFKIPDEPDVPVVYLNTPVVFSKDDVIVIPEGYREAMNLLKDQPARRIAIALNWRYAYMTLPNGLDFRNFGIERIITHSDHIGEFLTWAMKIPSHTFRWGIKPELYYYEPEGKQLTITFLARKISVIPELLRVLHSRNPEYYKRFQLKALKGLTEPEYAEQIRKSTFFLNLSEAEGLPCSLLEAMRAGTFVAGYNSVGGKRELIGQGEKRNCILVENLDYPELARGLEPLLEDLMAGDVSKWEPLRQNAIATSMQYTMEGEEESVVSMWRQLLHG